MDLYKSTNVNISPEPLRRAVLYLVLGDAPVIFVLGEEVEAGTSQGFRHQAGELWEHRTLTLTKERENSPG